ncbi:MAG: S-layer homology domain-containing protein [Oscillospiraceae bacterium]|jgi:hypothetical protein|nr:S-layer homology domain-containing protein [Oscillospiraceae bacterium]
MNKLKLFLRFAALVLTAAMILGVAPVNAIGAWSAKVELNDTVGIEPTAACPVYTGAIVINTDTTINAIEIKTGLANSDILTATYTIQTGDDSYYVPRDSEKIIQPEPMPPLAEWDKPYNDAEETAWYYDAVKFVTDRGLMIGTGDGEFSPNATMTRAMLVTVLYRLEGSPTVSGVMPFSDVKEKEWYSDSILWASQNDIVYGYDNGTFGWKDPVTREQAVTILFRYAKAKGLDVSASADLSKYIDKDDISDWALDAMKWAVAARIIQGRTSETTVPKATSTRAEVAMIFMRYIEDFLAADGVEYISSTMSSNEYEPITVKLGSHIKWTLTVPAGTLSNCNKAIVIPEYNLEIELEEGDNLIAFTPNKPGTFIFSCWMDMIHSSITVLE